MSYTLRKRVLSLSNFKRLDSFFSLQAVNQLYEAVDRCEDILGKQRYLCGNTFTEADVRLFVTLIRFDEVFESLFSSFASNKFLTSSCVPGLCGSLQM